MASKSTFVIMRADFDDRMVALFGRWSWICPIETRLKVDSGTTCVAIREKSGYVVSSVCDWCFGAREGLGDHVGSRFDRTWLQIAERVYDMAFRSTV